MAVHMNIAESISDRAISPFMPAIRGPGADLTLKAAAEHAIAV